MINRSSNEKFMGPTFVWWQGVVEDINDPLKLGRVRVRVLGYHNENRNQIPVEHLPWAPVVSPIQSAAMSGIGQSPTGLLCGSWVMGFFRDGEEAQEPVVFGALTGLPNEKRSESQGFSDPNGVYPKEDYLEESDVSRLARGDNTEKTIVATKIASVETDIEKALNRGQWSEPETPYNAIYPKNHVKETESGHVQEFDDTPGSERIHTYHKSGTFHEVHPDGSSVVKVVSNNYTIVLQDNKILIKGSQSTKVDGSVDTRIKENLNVHVEGDVNILVEGNATLQTNGDFFHKVKGVYAVVSEGNMVFGAPRIDFNPSDLSSIEDPLP